MGRAGGEGWRAWRAVPRIVAGAIAIPVVVGFVALGAVVVVVRSLRDVARDTWARVPPSRGGARERSGERDSDPAWGRERRGQRGAVSRQPLTFGRRLLQCAGGYVGR